MAEAHDPLAPPDELADPRLGPFGRADLVELVDHLGRGAAVERALQGADRAADRGGEVRAGRRDDPRGERRGVQAVLGADDEVGVEGPGGGRIRALAVELLEEPGGEVERRCRARPARGPARSRPNAASADGENAVRARACSGVGGQASFWAAPQTETAVRRASIGLGVAGQLAERGEDGAGTRRRWSSASGCHSPVQSRSATCGVGARARRAGRSGSRGTAAGRSCRRPARSRSRLRRLPRGPASRAARPAGGAAATAASRGVGHGVEW